MKATKKPEGPTNINLDSALPNFTETESFVKANVNKKGDTGVEDNLATKSHPPNCLKSRSKPVVDQELPPPDIKYSHRKPPSRFPRGSKGDPGPRGAEGDRGEKGVVGPGPAGTKGTTPARTKGTIATPQPTKGTAKPTAVQCPRPESPPHGTVSTFDGLTAEYKCDRQYKLSGSSTRHCGVDGTWEGRTPYCSNVLIPALLSSIIVLLVIGIVIGIVFVWRKLKQQSNKNPNSATFSQLKQVPDSTTMVNDSSPSRISSAKTAPLEPAVEDTATHSQNGRGSAIFSDHVPNEISWKSNNPKGEESPGIYEYVEVKQPESTAGEKTTSKSYQNSPNYVNTRPDGSSISPSGKASKKGQKIILPVQSHYVNTQVSTGSEGYMEMGSSRSEPTNVYEPLESSSAREVSTYDIPRSSKAR